jgi:protein deglycase
MVLLFLANGVESYELSSFIDVFSWNEDYGNKPVKIQTAGLRDRVLCTGGNLTIIPEKSIDEININDYTALAIPGGFGKAGFYEDAYNERFLELIRQFDRSDKIIASICVGALPIGKSGVLKDRKATTYKGNGYTRRNELSDFGAIVLDELMVIDKNIITSTGPSTAIDVALKLLELLTDKDNSSKIRRLMGF